MKKLLNVSILLLFLAAGFGLALGWNTLWRMWNGPGFNRVEPGIVTGVGDAPQHRGYTLAEPLENTEKVFDQWQKQWVTALGIQYTAAWSPEQVAATAKAARARKFVVTLLPPPEYKLTNPYPRSLALIAAEAQAARIDRLCVSWLDQAPDPAYWTTQIADVRQVFKGKVILAATDRAAPAVTCWRLSDFVGIAGPITLPRRLSSASDSFTFHDMRVAWDSPLTSLESLGRTSDRPLALLSLEVPVNLSMKHAAAGKADTPPPDNPRLQAMAYEALLTETKGRTVHTDMMLLMWGSPGNRNAANAVPDLLPKITEAWDPKKPRPVETKPALEFDEAEEEGADDTMQGNENG